LGKEANPKFVPAGAIGEFASHAPVAIGDAPPESLRLPIKRAPEPDLSDSTAWANAVQFGATPHNTVSKVDPTTDDTDGIQWAIDSGAAVVYLPNGTYRVSRTIVVRGNVRAIIGMQSAIAPAEGATVDPLVRFAADEPTSACTLEQLWIEGTIEHDSPGTLASKRLDMTRGYRNTPRGTGDAFFEDTIGRPIRILHPQNAWMRQVNCEFGKDPLIENHGGTLWVLGYTTEGESPVIRAVGGQTEVLGSLIYPLHQGTPGVPMFSFEDADFSLNYAPNGGRVRFLVDLIVTEGARRHEILPGDVPHRGPALVSGRGRDQ
jgi:hypothetical protein